MFSVLSQPLMQQAAERMMWSCYSGTVPWFGIERALARSMMRAAARCAPLLAGLVGRLSAKE